MNKFNLKVAQKHDWPELILQKEYLPALSGLKDLVILLSYGGLINWIAKKYAVLKY